MAPSEDLNWGRVLSLSSLATATTSRRARRAHQARHRHTQFVGNISEMVRRIHEFMRHGANISSATAQAHGQPRVRVDINFVIGKSFVGNARKGQNDHYVINVFFDLVAQG